MSTQALVARGRTLGIFRTARMDQLGAWFETEYPSLVRFAYFVCGNRTAAEDLVQDAFVRLSGSRARIEDPAFPAYVRRTILNTSRSAFRRRSAERRALTASIERPDFDQPHDEMWDTILALSPKQRACIALRYYEDMPEARIAEVLGISPGSVKTHTSRAMERLRAVVGERRQS